jgi:hypothetical protein
VGRIVVNPTQMQHNPEEWGRPLDIEYARKLGLALFTDSAQPQEGEIIIFKTTMKEAKRLTKKTGLKEMYKRKAFYISGNHTGEAMACCQDADPDARSWREHECILYQVETDQDDPETLRFLRGESDMTNKKHLLFKAVSFKEYFPKMVVEGREWVNKYGSDMSWFAAVKADWSSRFGLDEKSIGLIWTTARRTGPVGDLIMQCITGKDVAKPKSFKCATSNTYFAGMAKVPASTLIDLLRKVVRGNLSLSEFSVECKMVKVEMLIRQVVVEQSKCSTWAEGQKKFPYAFDDRWVSTWTRSFAHAKKMLKKSTKKGGIDGDSSVNQLGVPLKFLEELKKRMAKSISVSMSLFFFFVVLPEFLKENSVQCFCGFAVIFITGSHSCVTYSRPKPKQLLTKVPRREPRAVSGTSLAAWSNCSKSPIPR